MPKKKISKKRELSSKKSTKLYFGLIILTIAVATLFPASNLNGKSAHVLGISTLLARGGDDSGGENEEEHSGGGSSGGSNSSSSGGSSNSGSSSSGSSNTSNSSSGSSKSEDSKSASEDISKETSVNCTGPDGKIFQTKAAECEELNKKWNHPVSFTKITTPKQAARESSIEVESKDQETKINLKKHGTVIELKTNQGKIELHTKQEDGTETEIHEDSLEEINDELAKENESEIEHDSSGAFVLKHGSTRAKTNLPISVNLETKELTVTTSKGTKVVAVLPDEAVNKLISLKIIDNIETQTNDNVSLTEANNNPVFEVKGVDNQKLLGFFPVKIHKTVHVSAENGDVKTTNESLDQRILDLLSF